MKCFYLLSFIFISFCSLAHEQKEMSLEKSITKKISKEEYSEREIDTFRILENYESYRPDSSSDVNRNPLNKTPKRYKFEINK